MDMNWFIKFLFIFSLVFSNISFAQTDEVNKNDLNKTLKSIEQKIDDFQRDKQNQEVELAKETIERANTIISWSGYILAALALFLTAIGVIGLFEISKLNKIRKDFDEKLLIVKQEIENIDKNKAMILNEAKKFTEINYFLNQGKQLYRLGQHFEAREHLKKVISIDPNNIEARYYIGNSYSVEDKFDDAINEFEKILKIDPKNAIAYYGIGLSYGTKNIEKAIENYKLAIKSNPSDARVYNRLGTLLRLSSLDEALSVYQEGARLKESANTSFNIGLIYYAKNEMEKAKKYFIDTKHFAFKEIEGSKSPKWQYHFLAVISCIENKPNDANELYQKALEIDNSIGIRRGMKSDLDFLTKRELDKGVEDNIENLISLLDVDISAAS